MTLVLDDTEHRFLVSSLSLIMALLVAQTRVEAGVHSTLEVAAGGAARRARDARDLPGVLRMTDAELLARRRRDRSARLRAVLEVPRRLRRAVPRRSRDRRGQRRERRVPARGLCGATALLARDRRGLPAGRLRRRRDHGVAVRRLPPMACRDAGRAGRVSKRRPRGDRPSLTVDAGSLPGAQFGCSR